MPYTVNITKIEILDTDTNDLAGKVEVFDAGAVTVKIDCLSNITDWTALAVAVGAAIEACALVA